jgi:hypothetical protein
MVKPVLNFVEIPPIKNTEISKATIEQVFYEIIKNSKKSCVEITFDILFREMLKRLETLQEEMFFHDISFYFLRRKTNATRIFFTQATHFRQKINYIILNLNNRPENLDDLENIFSLFNYRIVIYPFPVYQHLVFTHDSIVLTEEYEPRYIAFDYRSCDEIKREAFEMFISYSFLYIVLNNTNSYCFYKPKLANFTDVYMESSTVHEKFEKILLSLSRIFPDMNFFVRDHCDICKLYNNNNTMIIPTYLWHYGYYDYQY